jgi:cell wall-associated NlpC family hydrolase
MRPLLFLAAGLWLFASTASSARAQVQVIVGGADPTSAPFVAPLKHKPKPKPAAARPQSAQPEMITPGERPTNSFALAPAGGGRSPSAYAGSLRARLLATAMQFIGTPYVWGGASPAGFDCSGFVQYTLASVGINVPRTADDQFYALPAVAQPEPGDLVFFQTYLPGPSHVGIYLGNGSFLNAIANDVHISSFASSYFTSRYLGARRAISD